jgi:hypothetical protein
MRSRGFLAATAVLGFIVLSPINMFEILHLKSSTLIAIAAEKCALIFDSLYTQSTKVGSEPQDIVNTSVAIDGAWTRVESGSDATVRKASDGTEIIDDGSYTYTKYSQSSTESYAGKGYKINGTISRQSKTSNNLKKIRFGSPL